VDPADRTARAGGKKVDNQNEYKQVDTVDRTTRKSGEAVDN